MHVQHDNNYHIMSASLPANSLLRQAEAVGTTLSVEVSEMASAINVLFGFPCFSFQGIPCFWERFSFFPKDCWGLARTKNPCFFGVRF